MKLALCDFWPGFDPVENFFVDFFKSITDVQLVKPREAEVLIYSCFGAQHHSVTNACKVFYTGENKRPNFDECNYSISFDLDDYNGRNIRLPLWMLYIDWFGKGGYNSPSFIIAPDKIKDNAYIQAPKTHFCSLVNSHLGNDRDIIIKQLATYRNLGLFGAPWGTGFVGEETKYRVISKYKFNICFENTNYPGYHTEKLLQAKTAGCIPIYNGDKTVEQDFNPNCFINLQDCGSMSNLCSHIIKIDTNDELYELLRCEPLFKVPPTLDAFTTQIRNTLKI